MAVQLSVAVRNARLDQIESTIGVSAKIKLFSGAVPANCAAADPSGLLATIALPSDWMNAASSGSKTMLGTWTTTASGAGTAICFRLYATDGTTCGAQGSVGLGSGDLSLDNNVLAVGQTINVTTFTLNDANA